jgi:hypothetical protein
VLQVRGAAFRPRKRFINVPLGCLVCLHQRLHSQHTTVESVWTGIEISAFSCTTWPTSTPGGLRRARELSLRLGQCDELHLLTNLLERVRTNFLALAAEAVPAWRQGLRRKNLRTMG